MTLLETRKQYGISQIEAAEALKISVRTYIRYEKDDTYGDPFKRKMMIATINDKYETTETKGLLNIDTIKEGVSKVFESERYKGQIDFCYLFGSYAKGYATEKSDVDLCVATKLTGFAFFGLVDSISTTLHKAVDLIRFDTLQKNFDLLTEIMKDGIKIY